MFQVHEWPWVSFFMKSRQMWVMNETQHTILTSDIRAKLDPPDIKMCGSRMMYIFKDKFAKIPKTFHPKSFNPLLGKILKWSSSFQFLQYLSSVFIKNQWLNSKQYRLCADWTERLILALTVAKAEKSARNKFAVFIFTYRYVCNKIIQN